MVREKFPLWEQLSKVTITDQFTIEYMNVLKIYDIKAKLINKMTHGKDNKTN